MLRRVADSPQNSACAELQNPDIPILLPPVTLATKMHFQTFLRCQVSGSQAMN